MKHPARIAQLVLEAVGMTLLGWSFLPFVGLSPPPRMRLFIALDGAGFSYQSQRGVIVLFALLIAAFIIRQAVIEARAASGDASFIRVLHLSSERTFYEATPLRALLHTVVWFLGSLVFFHRWSG